MGLRKIFFTSDPDPDKNDPKYKAQYESDVEMGRKAARLLRFDKAVYHIQRYAERHRQGFVIIVICLVTVLAAVSMSRLANATQFVNNRKGSTAVQMQEKLLEKQVGKLRQMDKKP